jgi:hypothetical protein
VDISKEELGALIETAVSRAMQAHVCVFSAEEKQILKDLASGGKAFKQVVIYLIIGFILVGIGIKNAPDLIKALK